MARHDGTLIDASPAGLEQLPTAALDCPLCVAHRVNHPPPGTLPNVMPAAFTFDEGVPSGLLPLLPNISYTSTPLPMLEEAGATRRKLLTELLAENIRDAVEDFKEDVAGATLPALALVATRKITDGEELYLNYRYNPANPLPAWYAPVDPAEDSRRWSSW